MTASAEKILADAYKARANVSELQRIAFDWRMEWLTKAHAHQIEPEGDWWTIWLLLGGRGAGKTRGGAEWTASEAWDDPGSRSLVAAPTSGDIRDICFEGDSGLLSVIPPPLIRDYNRSLSEIVLVNGSLIKGISASEPSRFRGPQWNRAWCFAGGTPVLMADGSEMAIERVRVGDMVSTRHGVRRVIGAGLSGNPGARYRIKYGQTNLIATGDHPILTQRGWVEVAALVKGDLLWSVSGTAENLGGSAQTGISPTGGMTNTCTGRSGRTITALFRLATSFITRTKIRATTTYQTWRCSRTPNTCGSTIWGKRWPQNWQPPIGKGFSSIGPASSLRAWFASGAAPHSKALVRTLAHSARRLALRYGVAMPLPVSSASAPFAMPRTWPQSASSYTAPSDATCAPITSGRPSIPPQSRAPSAAPDSSQSGTTPSSASVHVLRPLSIESVERLPTLEPVYNLTIEGEHEFIAGGVVVHNCEEFASWDRDEEALDMIMFSLRLGQRPRMVMTTTPKPKTMIRSLVARNGKDVALVTATSMTNMANLAPTFRDQIMRYEGTQIFRQEALGELLDPEEAGIVKRSQFRLWPASKPLPAFDFVVMSLDTAFTEATTDKKTHEADFTACTVWGGFKLEEPSQPRSLEDIPELEDDRPHANRYETARRPADDLQGYVMLLDCWAERLGFPDLIAKVKRELNVAYGDDHDVALIKPKFGASKPRTSGRKVDLVIIEAAGAGISLRQSLDREGVATYPFNPGRADKLMRLHLASPAFARRKVWLPESDRHPGKPRTWIEPLLEQLCAFSGEGSIKHDDYVDAVSQAIRYFFENGMMAAVKSDNIPVPQKKRANPYDQ